MMSTCMQAVPFIVLMADDSTDDCLVAQAAWDECRLGQDLRFVHDGEELMNYLTRRGVYGDPVKSPRPGLIILDLNMPKKDGCSALVEIKSDQELQDIPVLVLTTSRVAKHIDSAYNLGAHSFITKPNSLDGYLEFMKGITKYRASLQAMHSLQRVKPLHLN
ncbi:response regulator [Candidatus Nitrospira salsa]|nr:MAG: response regulator [Nitrospirales bacterium]